MIQNMLCIIFTVIGLALLVVSVVGTLKFPDFYAKLHALGLGQTLAFICFTIGIAIYLGFQFVTLKFIIVMAAIMIAGPIGTHIVDKVAFEEAMKNKKKEKEEK